MDEATKWSLAFVTPNLQLNSVFEFEHLAFVPNADERLTQIRAVNRAARALLDGFSDHGGQKLHPGAVIYSACNPFADLWAAIVDARNCLAVASALNGWQLSIGEFNNFLIRITDYFDFYPRWPSKDGKDLCYRGPALDLVSHVGESFAAQPPAYIPPSHPLFSRPQPEEDLFVSLQKIWRRVHVTRRAKAADSRLLRSLSVAYEACRVPQAMDNPLYDHGKHCSLWISAFETLAHPGRGGVSLETVLDLLGRRVLNDARVSSCKVMKLGRSRLRALNLMQRLYVRLYRARNVFLHGNRLAMAMFVPHGLAKGVRLLDVAPLIYLVALESHFGSIRPRLGKSKDPRALRAARIEAIMRYNLLEEALCRATGADGSESS